MHTDQQQKQLDYYYANNAKKLRDLIDGMLLGFGGIYDKDKDDFYSIGNAVFVSALGSYKDGQASFGTYLYNCLSNRIKTEVSKRNAKKRTAEIVSIDDDDTHLDIADESVFDEKYMYDESASRMFKSLPRVGKKIVEMRLSGKTDTEIKKELGLCNKQFDDELAKAQSAVLRTRKNKTAKIVKPVKEEEEMATVTAMTVAPDYRDAHMSLATIMDKISDGEMLINHPNQRNDWAWTGEDISNLVATNLHGFKVNPLIVCEEVRSDGGALKWIVDGKQRITSMMHFAFPGDLSKPMKISPKTEYAEIPYQSKVVDKNGEIVRDEIGRPVYETKTFDIRGKSFNDFPEELQKKFLAYTFDITEYVNCDTNMISYHIRRYNKGKAMNGAEKANTYLSERNAALCKKVAENTFFDNVPFSSKNIKSGASWRCVMDSIFASFYRDSWVKEPNKMYALYNEIGDSSDFKLIDSYLDRLNDVLDDETSALFTPKDAYLFIALFNKFDEFGIDDSRFNEFLYAFISGLRNMVVGKHTIDGTEMDVTFDNVDTIMNRATRSKGYVVMKIEVLEKLLGEYFGKNE